MEEWILHDSCNPRNANTLMGSWPLIKTLNAKFPTDCVFIDLERVSLLFDDKGIPIMERFDSESEFWTHTNPLPVNAIADKNDILELWEDPIFKPKEALFRQTQDEIKWMMKIHDAYPKTTILVIGQSVEIVKAWDSMDELVIRLQGFTNSLGSPAYIPEKKDIPTPVITCYMIQSFGDAPQGKPKPMILTTVPNMSYNWYCRYCAKCFPSKRCPKCAPGSKDNPKSLEKKGTFYCNAECQKADWKRHKKECKA
jgi:MYND finger